MKVFVFSGYKTGTPSPPYTLMCRKIMGKTYSKYII